ncbi:MAG: hypothetical protein KME25_25135 [Symplocastrum torsivum CPER-KK1]|jgi:N6-adenosine-specific RNA methylase IME4|uniref:DNA methyltransferase n=1 Tax=Symplocastrum torsivum CPER-KK1 TaxID=450513 RepID=A0A951PQD2_9CYAN|nr:hypothetical protein [Symplocastrum torsivum CPER-KK1]
MSFIRSKKVGEHIYYQEVENYRDESGKHKQRVLKHFGTQDPRSQKYSASDKRGLLKQSLPTTSLKPFPRGPYSLIVADPPWQYTQREKDPTHRNRTPYPNMMDKEILRLQVGEIALKDSYLLLWVTNNHLPLGFRCLETWGFEYKSIFTWVKVSKDGSKPRIGVGHYGRNCTEHFLVATKGKPGSFTKLGLRDIPNVIFSPRTEHSRKPEEFFTIANRLGEALGGQRVELFARAARYGWEVWGNEV